MDKQLKLWLLFFSITLSSFAQGIPSLILQGKRTIPITTGTVNLYGDSMSSVPCVGVLDASTCWDKLSSFTNRYGTPNIWAISGDMAADVAYSDGQFYNNVVPAAGVNGTTVFLIGYNDATICLGAHPGSAGCENNMFHALLNLAAWASIPDVNKVLISGCSTTGTWTGSSVPPTGAILSTVPTSTITCAVSSTTATAIYISWFAADAFNSSASVVVDGGSPITMDAFGYDGQVILTHNGASLTEFAIRVPVTPGGAHSFTITVNTADASNPWAFTWAGVVPKFSSPTGPHVVLGGIMRQYLDTNGVAGADIDNQVKTIAAQLQSDGALLYFSNIRQFVNTTSDMSPTQVTRPDGVVCLADTGSPPGLHPNNCGMQGLANAFYNSLP